MRKIFTIVLLIISSMSFAQKLDSTQQKQLEFIEKITYGLTSELFKPQEVEQIIDTDYKLPWLKTKVYTKEQLKTALDTLGKNATITIKEGMSSSTILAFNSYFPKYMEDIPFDFFKLRIKSSTIEQDNKVLEIQERGSSGFGSHFHSGVSNGNSYNYNWKTINTSFPIKSEIKSDAFSGKVEFETGFVYDYEYIKITKSDIGKKIKLGNYRFTVIDYINSSVVLALENGTDFTDFSLVNVNDNQQRIKTKGMSFSKQTVSKAMYDLFKEDPDLSFEDYKKVMRPKFLSMIKTNKKEDTDGKIFGQKYVVLSNGGTLENAYVFVPNSIQKILTIEYSKDQKVREPIKPKPDPAIEKINLHFEKENSQGLLLGKDIQLFDEELKEIESITEGTFVKIIGKSSSYYLDKAKSRSCNGFNYIKILYNDKEYVVNGTNVFKMKKLNIQPTTKTDELEILTAESSDFLQALSPDQSAEGMTFCDHLYYKPILIHNLKSGVTNLITLQKTEASAKITDDFKEARFFQAGSNYKIYDNVRKIEDTDKGLLFTIKRQSFSYNVLVAKKGGKYSASYIK